MATKSHDLSLGTIAYVFYFTNLIWVLTREQCNQYFLIFWRLISQIFRRIKIQQNMRMEENNGYIVRGKSLITNLSIALEISTGHLFIICLGKRENKKE